MPLLLLLALAQNDPWAGFEPGSWVVVSKKTTADGKAVEKREKQVILPPDGSGIRRELFVDEGGTFVPAKRWSVHSPGVFGEAQLTLKGTRRESVDAGGRILACEVTDYDQGDADGPRVRLSLWRCEGVKVPYRELAKDGADLALRPDVVKVELSIEREMSRERHVLQVVKLEERVKVGAQELGCVVEEWTVDDVRGGEPRQGIARRWLSDAVPGRVVRLKGSMKSAQGVREHVEEVVEFEVVPRR